MTNDASAATLSARSPTPLLERLARSLRWGCGSAALVIGLTACGGGGGDGQSLTADAQAQRDQTAAIGQAQQAITARIAASVQPGSASENFESGMADWGNWGNTQVVAGAGSSGSSALQVGTAAGGAGLTVPSVVAGTQYRLTANVRVSDLSDPGVVGVNFYNAAGDQLAAYTSPQAMGSTYAPLTLDAAAPANSAYALVWVWKNAGTGYVYVDDVAFGPASAPPPPPPPPPPEGNLLSNPGFEAGMTDWFDWGNSRVVNDQANSGTAALTVGTAAGGGGHLVEGITPGTTYHFAVSAKVSDASEMVFAGVNFINQAGAVVGTTQLFTTSTSYTTLSADATAAPDAVRAVVYVWKNAGSGLGYVDDFWFGVAPGTAPPLYQVSPNLVVNGGFNGLSGWADWGNTTIVGPRPPSLMASVGTGAGGFGQKVDGIIAGETYRLTASVKVSTADEVGYLGLKFLDAAGNGLQDQLVPFNSTALFNASVQLVAPPNAASAVVYVWKNAGSGYAMVGDVALVQMGTTAPPPVVQLSGSAQDRLDADSLRTHRDASVARLGNGNYVAAWVATSAADPGLTATEWQVCFQRLDPNLARMGPNACVPGAQATNGPTQVLARPDGGFVILWTIIRSIDGSTINFAQRSQAFDAAGNALGGIQDGPQQPVPASAAALAGGGYVVVSAAVGNPVPRDVSNLSFQRYSADGTPIGSPTSVGDKGGLAGAMVVPLAGGGFAVAWNGAGPATVVYTRVFTADGTPVGEPVVAGGAPLFCSNGGCPFQTLGGLSPTDDGGYVVIWMNGFGMGTPLGTFARRFKPDGTPGAAVGKVSDTLVGGQVAAAGPDGFVLVWDDDGGTGGPGQIVMRRFDTTPLR